MKQNDIIFYVQLYIKIKIKYKEKEGYAYYNVDQKMDSEIDKETLNTYLKNVESIFSSLGNAIGFEVISSEFCTHEEYKKSEGWPEYTYSIDDNGEIVNLKPKKN